MNASLNLSGKIDSATVSLFEIVTRELGDLEIPYVVVGATARDLVMHYGYGANIKRASHDVDFGINIQSWELFHTLRARLCDEGFTAVNNELHKLISPDSIEIDIVPFGGIEDADALISWPPDGNVSMQVLGFAEACENAQWVCIRGEPELMIPVATPVGVVLLKVIAWIDRPLELRSRDALDIAYLLSNYERIPHILDLLYDEKNFQMMETYEWDITQSAAHLLGQQAGQIAYDATIAQVDNFVNDRVNGRTPALLVDEMSRYPDDGERNDQLLTAFLRGFRLML